jgi:uncharacterized protein (TIGR02246 family)
MGKFSRDEIEQAIDTYKQVAREAGRTGNWDAWAELFTEDSMYIDHGMGVFGGREAIRTWITRTMTEFPASEMKFYPWEWYIIDEERGWVTAKIWNRMTDPGDGTVHQEYNLSYFKYAGNGMWALEEDAYNPLHFQEMIVEWMAVRDRLAANPSLD